MKTCITFAACLVLAACCLVASHGGESLAAGKELCVADYSSGKICLLDAAGKITWEHKAPACNELWVLPNGNLLFTTGSGVLEVTRDNAVVFKYEGSMVDGKNKDGTPKQTRSEIYACQRLPDGNTFIGECNSGRLLEVAPDGKIVKEVKLLEAGKDGGHAFIRNARKLVNGNYLVAHYGSGVVKEYDPQGKVVLEIKSPSGPHSVCRLPNGNTVIAEGDRVKEGARVFEVDKDGKEVWAITNNDLEGKPLKFCTGFQRLPNGNTLLTNWLGHGNIGKAPHMFEVTPDKKVVWTYANHTDFKTLSSIQVLGIPGDPIKGEVFH